MRKLTRSLTALLMAALSACASHQPALHADVEARRAESNRSGAEAEATRMRQQQDATRRYEQEKDNERRTPEPAPVAPATPVP